MSEKVKKRVEETSHHWTGSERDAESPMLQTSFLRCGMLVEAKVRRRAQIMSEWRQWRRLHATFGGCGEYLMFNSGGGGEERKADQRSPVRIPISGKWKDRIPYNVRYGVVRPIRPCQGYQADRQLLVTFEPYVHPSGLTG
ncbi:hypothetical protein C8J57DRAFT_1241948 [Mycena rebaudengoi]|nr:hypothetical protein C8J57DRAFT_1241948 [Mycena rebaudengoi]